MRPAYQLEQILLTGHSGSAPSKDVRSARHEFSHVARHNAVLMLRPVDVSEAPSADAATARRRLVRDREQASLQASDAAYQRAFETARPLPAAQNTHCKLVQRARHSGIVPPGEWIVDIGCADEHDEVVEFALKLLRESVRERRTIGLLPDERGTVDVHQSLYVSSLAFVNARVSLPFMEQLLECFRGFACSISLRFQHCVFTDDGAFETLGERFRQCGVSLTALTLAYCQRLPYLKGRLARVVTAHGETLSVLSLRGTFLGAPACEELSDALAATPCLVELDVGHTGLTNDATIALASGVRRSHLRALNVDGVTLPHGVGGQLYLAVQACSSLCHVEANNVDRGSTRFRKLLLDAAACHVHSPY